MPKLHPSITPDRIAVLADRTLTTLDDPGLCAACGAEAEGIEPDAANVVCDGCGRPAVCGIELIAIMAF